MSVCKDGRTSLHLQLGISEPHLEIVKYLIEYGADANANDNVKQTYIILYICICTYVSVYILQQGSTPIQITVPNVSNPMVDLAGWFGYKCRLVAELRSNSTSVT